MSVHYLYEEMHEMLYKMILLDRERNKSDDENDEFIDSIWNDNTIDTMTSYKCLSYMKEIGVIQNISIIHRASPLRHCDSLKP